MVILFATLLPLSAIAQGDYGVRIPSKLPGCFAPVASQLIGSNENDHTRRGSPTLAYDWSASIGSPVFSICPGTVRRTSSANEGGYGWNVIIDHDGGYSTLYAHCLENSFKVKAGQQVTAWTQICSIGLTGMTSWPHVHLNIDYKGVHQPVGKFFDGSLLHYCHFNKCQATNKPGDPIRNSGQWVGSANSPTGAPVAPVSDSRYAQLLRILAQYPPQKISLGVMAILGALVLIYWLGGQFERVAIGALVFGMVGAALIVWLTAPVGGAVQAGQPTATIGGSAFETALKVTLKREGTGCDTYIVRTRNGVTQWTYDRYRREKGLPRGADVCQSLTESEWRYIYYNYYWLPSGANKLSINAAIPVFDHFVNAGRLIKGCGDNVQCINQQRRSFYLSTADCARRSTVCSAWLNRVEYIRGLTEGGQ